MPDRKLYYNGTILTMDDQQPHADFVLTENGVIADVGGKDRLAEYLGSDVERVDLQGRLLLPGFLDSHLHMLTAALNRLKLDVTDMPFDTVDDFLAYVRREKGESGESWISVFGFSEENLGDRRMVERRDIDKYFPDVPVTIIRVCGHMCVVNSQAIARLDADKMAAITGGEFKKDADGAYNGLATEGAQQYVLDNMPTADVELILGYMQKEQEILLRQGITSIHDAGTDMMLPHAYVAVFEEMERRGLLKLRTYLMARPGENEPPEAFDAWMQDLKARYDGTSGRLQIGSVKLFADGSLGSRTAALKQPYQDEPDNMGLLLDERLNRYIVPLAGAGHQVAVHAIGDRSSAFVADLYRRSGCGGETRQRIEHAELLDQELLDTFKAQQILVMTQPIFIREFGNTYFQNLGESRALRIQPIRSMLEQGIVVGFGTDYPVDDPNPLLGIHAAMTREIKNSSRLLNPEEAISFEQAVKCYTLYNAYGAFREQHTSSLEKGKSADLVILSGITPDADGQIRNVRSGQVDCTVIAGETVYARQA